MDVVLSHLPEGVAVTAVILIVFLFLKQQRWQQKQINLLATDFNAKLTELATTFKEQLNNLVDRFERSDKAKNEQIQSLFDRFLVVSKETVSAVVELRGSVEGLAKKIERMDKKAPG